MKKKEKNELTFENLEIQDIDEKKKELEKIFNIFFLLKNKFYYKIIHDIYIRLMKMCKIFV